MRKSNKLSKKVANFLNMENILALLFAMFIIFNVSIPKQLSKLVDNVFVQVVLGLLVISLFISMNPIVGILGFLALYELIKRSKNFQDKNYLFEPTESQKLNHMKSFNTWDKTLEEDIINKMGKIPTYNDSKLNYKPSDSTMKASPL